MLSEEKGKRSSSSKLPPTCPGHFLSHNRRNHSQLQCKLFQTLLRLLIWQRRWSSSPTKRSGSKICKDRCSRCKLAPRASQVWSASNSLSPKSTYKTCRWKLSSPKLPNTFNRLRTSPTSRLPTIPRCSNKTSSKCKPAGWPCLSMAKISSTRNRCNNNSNNSSLCSTRPWRLKSFLRSCSRTQTSTSRSKNAAKSRTTTSSSFISSSSSNNCKLSSSCCTNSNILWCSRWCSRTSTRSSRWSQECSSLANKCRHFKGSPASQPSKHCRASRPVSTRLRPT